ncbi:DUF6478 family protein [Albirhodobacter sp. R86504]|uniref:DUF6478 family protein n=1 Tax=Albirhodobacter sp. R86504 TaxID=3093848 RepID=UPI00366CF1E5
MSKTPTSFLKRMSQSRAVARWARFARLAKSAPLNDVRTLLTDAEALRVELDAFRRVAEDRVRMPPIDAEKMRHPLGTDRSWRPELWKSRLSNGAIAAAESRSALGTELKVFHDCIESELTLRQVRNQRAEDLAPFGLRMDVFRFDGTFLSLVLDVPQMMLDGLRLTHLVRLDLRVELEKPLEMFARLNVKHGPNTEQIVREIPLSGTVESWVEFDLAYTKLNEKRIERAWIDLIFEGPQMNQVVLRDLNLSRHPRAEI